MSLTVAMVVDRLTLGGTEKGLVTYAAALDRERFRPRVVCRLGLGPRAEALRAAGVPFASADGDPRRLRELLDGAALVHLWRGGTGARGVAGAAREAGAAAVVETDVFGLLDPSAPAVDCRLFLSRTCAVRYRRQAGLSPRHFHLRHRVLPLPLDHAMLAGAAPAREEAKRRLGLDPALPVVGRLGRADDHKWRNLLVDMLPELARLAPDAQVLLVGATSSKRRRLERRGVLGRCVLVDPVSSELELAALYAACDVFVTASELGESQGLAIAEAMALGSPVVTCATPWVDNAQVELVEHGRTGLLASHPRAFAEAVATLLHDGALRSRLGAAARERVLRRLDSGTLTGRLEALYTALLEGGAPPREWEPGVTELEAFEEECSRAPHAPEYRTLTAPERLTVRAARERERLRRGVDLLRPTMLPLAWSMLRARVAGAGAGRR